MKCPSFYTNIVKADTIEQLYDTRLDKFGNIAQVFDFTLYIWTNVNLVTYVIITK